MTNVCSVEYLFHLHFDHYESALIIALTRSALVSCLAENTSNVKDKS